jgi:phosphopantothenoylcysteine decarboxylase
MSSFPPCSRDANLVADSVDEARRAIEASQNAAFDNIYNSFLSSMDGCGAQDDAFVESLTDALNILAAPLAEEQIEATFTRDDKPVTEIIQMGKRIGMFQESVAKDEAKLSGYWKEWEELQDDFIELGCEVFGKDAFPTGVAVKKLMGEGFVRDLGMVTQEHSAMVEDLAEYIEEIGDRLLKELVASEEVSYLSSSVLITY